MTTSSAIEKVEYRGLMMATSPAEALRRLQELQAFVQEVMVVGEDYGKIPGIDKASLFQPGAQKLAEIYGFAHRFEWVEVVKEWERGFFYFELKCILTDRRTGAHVAEGIGSCNSKEDKYAYRWAFDLPPGIDEKTVKVKTGQKSGRTWKRYRLPNDDLYSVVNTLQKMAAKRAYVHAVVSATRSGGLFTQDVEDGAEVDELPAEAFGKVEERRPWEQSAVADTTVFDGHWASLEAMQTAGTMADFEVLTKKRTDDAALMTLAQRIKLRDFAIVVREEVKKRTPPPTGGGSKGPASGGSSPTGQAPNGSSPEPVRDQGASAASAASVAQGTNVGTGTPPPAGVQPPPAGANEGGNSNGEGSTERTASRPADGSTEPGNPPARDWAKEGQELWNRINAATTLDALTVLADAVTEAEKAGAPSTKAIRNLLAEKTAKLEPPAEAAAPPDEKLGPGFDKAPEKPVDWPAQERVMEGFIRSAYAKGAAETDKRQCDALVGSFMRTCPAAMAQRLAKMLREAKTGKLEPEVPFR